MKKIIGLILGYALLLNLTSCHSYSYISSQQEYKTHQEKKHVYALDLKTNTDSLVYFSTFFPGILSNSEVKGTRQVLLRSFDPDFVIYHKNNSAIKYAVKNGLKYEVRFQDSTELVCLTSDTIRIPFSEIKQIHIKEAAPGKTAGLILGFGAAVGLALYLIVANMTFDINGL